MSKLFTPIKIRDLEVKNRLWVSPMCMYSCLAEDGVVGQWHLVHLGARAVGGAGLVMAEASAVNPEGRISLWCPGIWNNEQVVGWRVITEFIRAQGSKSAIQLAHAGRKASLGDGNKTARPEEGGWQTYSSTDEAFRGYQAPRMLETQEVSELVEDFVKAAKNAVLAGFDALEIHAAHGYLIHQFLSPITNQRADKYGGSLENRARFLIEIITAIRLVIPEGMPLMIRFSATDYVEGGWDQLQTNQVAIWCKDLGVDLFDLSSGGIVTGVKIPTGPGYQVEFAKSTKKATNADVIAVGQITDAQQAEDIVSSGEVDIAMVGREFLRDPYFALRAAHQLGADIQWPFQYERGKWPNS